MRIIILVGSPGSGKGTQAGLLAEELGYCHFSTGEMLRKEIAANTELGKLAKSRIDDGNFVPDYVACEMVKNFIAENSDLKGIILDGFPRTLNQCHEFEPILKENNLKINMFINLIVEKDNLTKRLLNRNNQLGRPDDSDLSIIEHRFGLYNEFTNPICEYYKNSGHYYEIDGNDTILAVFKQLTELIKVYINI